MLLTNVYFTDNIMTTVKELPNGSKSPSFFRSVVSKLKSPVAPVSSRTQHHTPSPLKSQISDKQSRENVSRCQFTFADGRQCKTPRRNSALITLLSKNAAPKAYLTRLRSKRSALI